MGEELEAAFDQGKLAASWERCREHHALEQTDTRATRVLTATELTEASAPVDGLLSLCREEITRLHSQVKPLGYATIIAEPGGAVIERHCRAEDAKDFDRYGSVAGADWSEASEGTNGIGTCIAEKRPLIVHLRQHFRRRHARLSCAGAPVIEGDGALRLVLNVCSCAPEHSSRSHRLALAVVARSAREIEERQFRDRNRNRWVLGLQSDNDDGLSVLLSLDDRKRIVDADRAARRQFSLNEAQLDSGLALCEVFDPDPVALRLGHEDDTPLELTRLHWVDPWHGLVTPPLNGRSAAAGSAIRHWHTRPRLSSIFRNEPATRPLQARGGLSPAAFQRVRGYIESRLHESIGVEQLSKAAGLSPHHFSRVFKQSVGLSPHRYLMRQRIDHAAELLSRTNRSLADIAIATGFSDQSHFARYFVRLMGVSPGHFRRQKTAR